MTLARPDEEFRQACAKTPPVLLSSMRLRLLLWYWGRRGGGAQFTLGLARALVRRGDVEVSLSVSRQGELFGSFAELGRSVHAVETYQSLGGLIASMPRVPGLVRQLVDQARRTDVVVSGMTHLWTPMAAPALARAGMPFVPVVHDATPHPGDLAFAWDWRLHRELGASRAAVALSEAVADALRRTAPRLPVIRMPLPATLAASPSAGRAPGTGRFLFFGRLRAYKGLDLLRDAFDLLRRQHPGVLLRVVGEGDPDGCAPGLRDLPGVSVEQRWVPEAEIPDLLSMADIVVLPYREASQSGVAPQALAAGVPVVATPVGGLTEQVRPGGGGILATAVTPQALAAAMAATLEPHVLERLRVEALNAAEAAADWDDASEKLVRGLHDVLGKGAGRDG